MSIYRVSHQTTHLHIILMLNIMFTHVHVHTCVTGRYPSPMPHMLAPVVGALVVIKISTPLFHFYFISLLTSCHGTLDTHPRPSPACYTATRARAPAANMHMSSPRPRTRAPVRTHARTRALVHTRTRAHTHSCEILTRSLRWGGLGSAARAE